VVNGFHVDAIGNNAIKGIRVTNPDVGEPKNGLRSLAYWYNYFKPVTVDDPDGIVDDQNKLKYAFIDDPPVSELGALDEALVSTETTFIEPATSGELLSLNDAADAARAVVEDFGLATDPYYSDVYGQGQLGTGLLVGWDGGKYYLFPWMHGSEVWGQVTVNAFDGSLWEATAQDEAHTLDMLLNQEVYPFVPWGSASFGPLERGYPGPAPQPAYLITVPEPACALVVALCMIAAARRRRE
jgi:hypothetical protein